MGVALVLTMAATACEPANTVGIDLVPPPQPVYSETMREQLETWQRAADIDNPPCEVCSPEEQAAFDELVALGERTAEIGLTTGLGVGTCSWLTCTMIFSATATRIIASAGGIIGGTVEKLLAKWKATFFLIMVGAIIGYTLWMAVEAVNRTPDGCLALRWTHFPLPSGIPTWIGHVHAANSRCLNG